MLRNSLRLPAIVLVLAPVALAGAAAQAAPGDRQISEIIFQNYPPRALAAGEEGPVFFNVTLDKDATATSCQVTHSSGFPLLDEETCKLIVGHAVFKSARDANGRLVRQVTEGVVNWTLPGHTPAPINAAVVAPKDLPEKQICKKTPRIGTIADVERTCMTAREWARQTDEMKQTWEDVQGKKGFTSEDMCKQGSRCDSTIGAIQINGHQ
jgi:TonB family protein